MYTIETPSGGRHDFRRRLFGQPGENTDVGAGRIGKRLGALGMTQNKSNLMAMARAEGVKPNYMEDSIVDSMRNIASKEILSGKTANEKIEKHLKTP